MHLSTIATIVSSLSVLVMRRLSNLAISSKLDCIDGLGSALNPKVVPIHIWKHFESSECLRSPCYPCAYTFFRFFKNILAVYETWIAWLGNVEKSGRGRRQRLGQRWRLDNVT